MDKKVVELIEALDRAYECRAESAGRCCVLSVLGRC